MKSSFLFCISSIILLFQVSCSGVKSVKAPEKPSNLDASIDSDPSHLSLLALEQKFAANKATYENRISNFEKLLLEAQAQCKDNAASEIEQTLKALERLDVSAARILDAIENQCKTNPDLAKKELEEMFIEVSKQLDSIEAQIKAYNDSIDKGKTALQEKLKGLRALFEYLKKAPCEKAPSTALPNTPHKNSTCPMGTLTIVFKEGQMSEDQFNNLSINYLIEDFETPPSKAPKRTYDQATKKAVAELPGGIYSVTVSDPLSKNATYAGLVRICGGKKTISLGTSVECKNKIPEQTTVLKETSLDRNAKFFYYDAIAPISSEAKPYVFKDSVTATIEGGIRTYHTFVTQALKNGLYVIKKDGVFFFNTICDGDFVSTVCGAR